MKAAARIALAALPVLGLVELAAHVGFAHRAPAFDDYGALAPVVASMKRPGDVVIAAPGWTDPLVRRGLGDAIVNLRDEARPDVSRYAAAIEVSAVGQRSPELADFREVARSDVGKFVVRRLENPSPAHVVYDFTDHVRPEFASAEMTQPPGPCSYNPQLEVVAPGFGGHPAFPRERFQCPGGMFFFVGVTVIVDQDFAPRRCIWAHPPARGELVARFRDVPLGDEIRGHAGINWMAERVALGAPVTLAVAVDGDLLGKIEHQDGEGFAPFRMPLGAHSRAPKATVEFRVSTPNNRDRHFCFEADSR